MTQHAQQLAREVYGPNVRVTTRGTNDFPGGPVVLALVLNEEQTPLCGTLERSEEVAVGRLVDVLEQLQAELRR